MEAGIITNEIDVAQVTLYAFWLFFAGLIFYLRREDRREGYPLENEFGERRGGGILWVPEPKILKQQFGTSRTAPRDETDSGRPLAAEPMAKWTGAPLVPTGNPMVDGVGPAAYALREDVPDVNHEGHTKIAPMRIATDFMVAENDPDPRGMDVVCGDGKVGGKCTDLWIDRGEHLIRYLEVEVQGGRKVLAPMPMARVNREFIKIRSIMSDQFVDVPAHNSPDQVTRLEEDKISAYYGGGQLYAKPSRQEPLV